MKHAFLLASLLTLSGAALAEQGTPVKPIAALDVPRYMGTWYEIARFPNRFQKQCASDVLANYSVNPDSTVKVVNRCKLDNGATEEAIGIARQTGGPTSPILKVRFAPEWLSFIPLVWGDYWVIDLDEQYRLAAVSDRQRAYLWVLSRTPVVEQKVYADLIARLRAQGFDVNQLVLTKQGK